jgi:hypothetical protein
MRKYQREKWNFLLPGSPLGGREPKADFIFSRKSSFPGEERLDLLAMAALPLLMFPWMNNREKYRPKARIAADGKGEGPS